IQITINDLLHILGQPGEILSIVVKETKELIENYGDERRTKLVKGKIGEFSEEDLISNETTIITLTKSGYIKRLSPDSFRAQSRGGKGASGLKMKEEDVVKCLVTANTHDNLLLFTNEGRVFKLKAHEIPESSKQAKGTSVVNLVNLRPNEKIESMLIIDLEKDKEKFIALATRAGLVKKTAVKLYDNIRQNGIIAIDLNKGDSLVWGKVTTGDDDIMLVTHTGKSIRFSEKEVKASNRDTKGVKGITLLKDDYVIGVETINAEEKTEDDKQHLLVVTENGLGKLTKLSDYPLQKRSGIGLKVSEVNKKTGNIAMAAKVSSSHEELIIGTSDGQTLKIDLRSASIPILSRPTQGVILIRTNDGDKVVTATVTVGAGEDVTPTTKTPDKK
ncbi:MAG: hypothetical protein LBG64_02275, partial [Pseudomonadales bacterium]|nr:hypothetical protein [Pseudomonadales bacterium]